MKTLLQLRRDRAGLIEKARHLVDIVDGEERGMTEQEERDYESFMSDIESLETDIQRREKLESMESGLHNRAGSPLKPDPKDNAIGMSDKEVRRYSLVRAIQAAANRNWKGAELEMEASAAVAKRMGQDPQGFFVPYDWTHRSAEHRDLNVGTDTAGGHTVATDLLVSSFIDILRNRLVVRQAGATMLTGLVGDIAIPRQTGGATAYWVAESGAPTESQHTFDQVTMSPKTVGAFTDYSRKLLKQASIDVEMFVRDDIAAILALAIDLAGLHGSGSSNQPTGVAATSGIGSVAGGTNGAAPDWADIIDLETEVSADNADVGRLAYVTNARVRGKLKQTEKASGTAQFVWNGTELNGYTALVSNQVSSTLTKGTASGVCSAIFYGNWADLLVGMWGVLDMLVDPYTGSTSGTVRVVGLQDVDIAVRHAQSFAAMLDALTA